MGIQAFPKYDIGATNKYAPPTGTIVPYAGDAAPEGWLACDGTAVSRSTYSSLYATIGTTYGVGDGSATFNLPDLQGKVPVGVDTGQTEFDTLGETGGAKTHTLIEAEMPSHTHTINPPHVRSEYGTHDWVYLNSATPNRSFKIQAPTSASPTGGNAAHNNLQPYVTVGYLIWTGKGNVGDVLYDTIAEMTDVDLATTAPETGDALVYDGTKWVPGAVASTILNYVAKTSTYNIADSDCVIDCTSGTFTVYLPDTAYLPTGSEYVIKNSGTGVITLDGDGADTIDGYATVSISQKESYTVVFNGSNWIAV